MYDVAIIGAGPAGVSAAINLKLLNKSFVWLGGTATSDKAGRAELIKNYPGLPDVTGKQLCWALLNHAESMGIKPTQGVVTGVYDVGGSFSLLAGSEEYSAKSVILCVGVSAAKPVEGEEEFLGRGVSYCATCDGFFYKDKRVAVVADDVNFAHEIEYLANIAREVEVISPRVKFVGLPDNCRISGGVPKKIAGDTRARKLILDGGEEIEADGVFFLRSSFAPSSLVHGLKCDGGKIIADRECATNIAGVFAAGDCTGAPYQYAKSVGEGNVAAHSAVKYLSGKI